MSAGPGKKDTTVSAENFERMLGHLPIVKTRMTISGGEIFTVEDRLKEYLDLIDLENKKRDNNRKIGITLQTNGFWLKRKNAEEVLVNLKLRKIDQLDIASSDRYHNEQGLTLTPDLISLAERYIPDVMFRGSNYQIMPIGRAEHKRREYLNYKLDCKKACEKFNWNLSIKNSGQVSPCCFSFFTYPGNIFEEPLLEIIKKGKKDPRLEALDKRGFRGIAKVDGFNWRKIKDLIWNFGKCGACAKLYGKKEELTRA
jgi:MoaA/NifB/PqqE/SkfB family radical SAM enzyme